jgi:hypothetical protein
MSDYEEDVKRQAEGQFVPRERQELRLVLEVQRSWRYVKSFLRRAVAWFAAMAAAVLAASTLWDKFGKGH